MRLAVPSAFGFAVLITSSGAADAICREVVQEGSPPPVMEPKQPVLMVLRRDVQVGWTCPPGDGGGDTDAAPPADAGPDPDAGAIVDAGPLADAGPFADAGPSDAGPGPTCEPRYGDAVTMVVQPRFTFHDGGARFALLMVTPRPPLVEAAAPDIFYRLAEAVYPDVVTETQYIEDPELGYQCDDPKWNNSGCGGDWGGGGGGGYDDDFGDWGDPSNNADAAAPGDGTLVQTIGAYEVAILSVTDIPSFTGWLDTNDYDWDQADVDALAPYLALGWTVIAVKVNSTEPLQHGGLEPLAFTWEGTELRLPLGVSRFPQGGQTLLDIFIAADGRYEVPGATITYARWSGAGGASFLTHNQYFADLSLPAESDPIAIHIPGDPQYQDTITVTEIVRIPSSQCPDRDDGGLCDCRSGSNVRSLGTWLLVALAIALSVIRRR